MTSEVEQATHTVTPSDRNLMLPTDQWQALARVSSKMLLRMTGGSVLINDVAQVGCTDLTL
jgi:hypothetical protein